MKFAALLLLCSAIGFAQQQQVETGSQKPELLKKSIDADRQVARQNNHDALLAAGYERVSGDWYRKSQQDPMTDKTDVLYLNVGSSNVNPGDMLPSLDILCDGNGKYKNFMFDTHEVLSTRETLTNATQSTVTVRADRERPFLGFWNETSDFQSLFPDKKTLKAVLSSSTLLIQFSTFSDGPRLDTFNLYGLNPAQMKSDCGLVVQPAAHLDGATVDAIRHNSESAAASPAAANVAASFGHVISPQEGAELVREGKASVVAVLTTPPGATVLVDGKKAGVTPFVFNLLRISDQERTITIQLQGYKTYEQKIVPDGHTVPIGIQLEKEK